jgi:hypothetical protein
MFTINRALLDFDAKNMSSTQLAKEFDIHISNYHITRLLKSMGIPMGKLSVQTSF